ncbi:MAG: hypothetical protein PHS14_00010 [Elusimicrobia bacterium]|nr:hypothetical protein [Elusimicrobiota bacterium]
MENDEYVLVKARVIRRDEGVITVKLEDGFGNAEAVFHKDAIVPAQ